MNALLAEITAIVGPSHLLEGDDVSARRDDWMQGTPCRARAIVRPADAEQLSQVMAACHRARQPVVPHGGLTGLVGGSVASSDELAISLERMNQIDAIDPISGTLTVQAGTLGIVTRAVLKLKPQQPAMQTAMVACDTFSDPHALLNRHKILPDEAP